jgi:hypothetical protein
MHFRILLMRPGKHLLAGLPLVFTIGVACRAAPPESSVVPGLSVTVAQSSGPDTVIYRRSITRGGQDLTAGTRTLVRRVIAGAGGTRLLEVEQRFPGGGGEIVDTALADLRTLRAIAHSSHQPKRTMRFDFVGDTAQGTVSANGPAADTTRQIGAVHQALGGPLFDSNVPELVVAALPLGPRFTAELPFFIYERGGRVAMPVMVRERTRWRFPFSGSAMSGSCRSAYPARLRRCGSTRRRAPFCEFTTMSPRLR